ncbi:MAG: hypothetical protein NVSMB21_17720 [Vulcanimicrobiaceae bacterium]
MVATQMGSTDARLCKKLNAQVALSGKLYAQGGTTVLLVSAVK